MFDETGASEAEGEVAWLDEQVELHVTGNGRVAANGEADAAPTAGVTSERASELASDHWRERAVVWRERALAAELVAKVLQRNLNDLHATLEDLRREARAMTAAQELAAATHRKASATSPWRRFVRDLYDQYLR